MIRTAALFATATLTLAACSPPAPDGSARPDETDAREAAPPAAIVAARQQGPTTMSSRTKVFRDWIAACDNVNRCVAVTGAGADGAWLKVEIGPEEDARPTVSFGAVDPRDGQPVEGSTLAIDGRPSGTDTVAALGRGRRAAVTAGGQARPVSLGGAAAAFLWIDDQQGRLDTTAALIRRGEAPPRGVRPLPQRPRVTPLRIPGGGTGEERALPPALEALPAVRECRVDVPGERARVWRIGVEDLLWEVPCYRGAYNEGSRLFIAKPDGSDAHPLGLPVARGEPTPFIVNGDFDPESGLLTSFDKGRGVGDCGVARAWAWTGRGFVLTGEAAMEECWGVPSDQWPVLYEAIVE
ncbi:MAG TPA: DUF1176 domain-containing protein [Brevundimonas sp.]|jgi:hypothetical protein|uniref:DUF1176 domain-containing protein n=1 Tax=Brevundimonas sp. TaxID=1871086 RepID=UPI002DF264A9|nr:DUF1176 domain-containing protein [Brevundimonas sp.]